MEKKALLITNDAGITGTIADVLAKLDIETTVVASVSQAQFALHYQALPVCIIVDLSLSQTQCMEFLRSIKANERYAKLPILVTIELPDPQAIKDALQFGAARYITKAFLQRNLLHTVQDIMPASV